MLGALPLIAGCVSMAPNQSQPQIVADLPDEFGVLEKAGEYRPANWWKAFNDPVLDQILQKTLSDNLDLAESAARLRAAEAQARVSKSGLYPQVNLSGSASYSDSPAGGTAFGGLAGGVVNRFEVETYAPSLGFAYELDLWGRVRNQARAGRADAIAAAADLKAARLAIMAEAITNYFDLVDARAQIATQVKTIDLLNDRTTQTDSRYRRGLVTSFELYQIRQDFRNTQASLPQAEARLAAIEGQLAVLSGGFARDIDDLLKMPLKPQLVFESIPPGLPSSLLIQRPDVVASWQRLEAARYTVGVRKAEQFPAISLTSSIGTQAGDLSGAFDVMDNWVLSLGASLTAPLFQGGRIRANIALANAQYAQASAAYARTVITAFQEVRTAIAQYEEQRQRYRFLFLQGQEAQSTAGLQSKRFASGVGQYSDYLDALRQEYQIESALSSAGRDVALARLAVHRALGGDWAEEQEIEPVEMITLDEQAKVDDFSTNKKQQGDR
ncbi:MAG: TolC family protein [Parasphingorhabdus sp.]